VRHYELSPGISDPILHETIDLGFALAAVSRGISRNFCSGG
jgi:hypothetical protein